MRCGCKSFLASVMPDAFGIWLLNLPVELIMPYLLT